MKVLHLEDDTTLRRMLRRMMKGHEVHGAASAEEAIKMIDEINPDVIISDWHVEGGTSQSAIEIASKLGIPVLIMSASLDDVKSAGVEHPMLEKGRITIPQIMDALQVIVA